MPNTGIDQAVEQINKEVDEHDDAGNKKQAATDDGIISTEDRIDHPLADARRENIDL